MSSYSGSSYSSGSSRSYSTNDSSSSYGRGSEEFFKVTIVADFYSEDGFAPLTRRYTATPTTIFSDIVTRFESSSTVQDALAPHETLSYRTFDIRGSGEHIYPDLTVADNGLLMGRRRHSLGTAGVMVRACAGYIDHSGRFVRRRD
ncbi:hypothetical protein Dda_6366 [Drechslerella dactyloides]|uniref:Uncharacterized protein n=1 Tax=Drechslerella dactyloides TaxID=74499 RepID=A0AAD6NG59_DREDA|nr:hypothetical protein Dda_6366 [Drechslerella dactyloides]